jgi:pimeloyl-ACP methyl ester carboxylesterase
MRNIRYFALAAALSLFVSYTGCGPIRPILTDVKTTQAGEIVIMEPRPGVQLRTLFVHPAEPVAALVLLEAGSGVIGLETMLGKPTMQNGHGFLARNVYRFGENRLAAALVDAPFDQAAGLDPIFRTQDKHIADLKLVVETMKLRTGKPVWLVGSSAGAFSAVAAAERLGRDVGGIVLLSPPTSSVEIPGGLFDMNLAGVNVPVLIMVHQDDTCPVSRPEEARKIRAAMTSSPRTLIKTLTGGAPVASGACGPQSPHGFQGQDAEAVAAIVEFIKNAKP